MGSRDKALAIVREQMGVLFAPGLDTLVDVAIDDVVDKLLAIGRARGLREAAGICSQDVSDWHKAALDWFDKPRGGRAAARCVEREEAALMCQARITAAAEKAGRGDG